MIHLINNIDNNTHKENTHTKANIKEIYSVCCNKLFDSRQNILKIRKKNEHKKIHLIIYNEIEFQMTKNI